MINLKFLIQLIALILFYIIFGNTLIFYIVAYILSIIFTLPSIIEGIKEKSLKERLMIISIYFLYLFLSYYIIVDNNPINYIILYLLPFRNIFKGLTLIVANFYMIKYLFKKEGSYNPIENTDLVKEENNDLLSETKSDYGLINTKSLSRNKKLIFLIFLGLVLIKVIRFYYNNYFFIYLGRKNSLLPYRNETTYYICANLYNSEEILDDWIEQMKLLINYLGEKNVYVSIVENGDSDDKTIPMLEEFGKYLNKSNIPNKIITYNIIDTDRYRIDYLIDLRNAALTYLYKIPDLDFNKTKILFFNDIVFNYQDIIKLINTNKGDYDVACGMDYHFGFYDRWVSIGLDGLHFRDYFPYLVNKVGQDALIDNGLLRVFSCWNGVVSMKALPFENKTINFRSVRDFKESECTMINYDFYKAGFQKVLINTELVFAYNYNQYFINKFIFPWTYNFINYFAHYVRSYFNKNVYLMKNYEDDKYVPGDELAETFEGFERGYDPQFENRTIISFKDKI